jgi:hypothetical protein
VGTPCCQHGTAVPLFCEVLSAPSLTSFLTSTVSLHRSMIVLQEVVVAAVSCIVSSVSLINSSNDEACVRRLTHRYIILLCIYRLTFHLYAKYPGPFLGKVTTLRAVYYAYTGDMHLDMERCHQKYGQAAGLVLPLAFQLTPCQANLFGIVRTQS